MKKLIKILMVSMICLGLTACGEKKAAKAETTDDVAKIAEDNDLNDEGFDNSGLFWKFSFAGMEFSVAFNVGDDPKFYYVTNTLTLANIDRIKINPDKDIGSQWIYLRPVNGEFVVDEEDIKTYNDKGRKEAYEAYQKKFEKLGLTSELLAKWTIIQFNQNTRTDLIKNIQKDADTVLTKIKENGYNYEKDNKGRQIISSTEAYKIVISNKKCMVIDAAFDSEAKTGYMYLPEQGTCGYSINGATQFIYQYSDNTFLKGEPTLEQYAEMKNIKNWYDEFLNQFSTKTEILQLIK